MNLTSLFVTKEVEDKAIYIWNTKFTVVAKPKEISKPEFDLKKKIKLRISVEKMFTAIEPNTSTGRCQQQTLTNST